MERLLLSDVGRIAESAPWTNPVFAGLIVLVTAVVGGIILACVAAMVVKSVGGKAIDKADSVDVPKVLGILGALVGSFVSYLPTGLVHRSRSGRVGGSISSDAAGAGSGTGVGDPDA